MFEDDEPKGKRLIKPTLSAVLHAQEQLRIHLMKLIEENRCLSDEKERTLFLKEWNYGTLGFGKDFVLTIRIGGLNGPAIKHGTDYFARKMAMETDNEKVFHQNRNNYDPDLKTEIIVPISFFWKNLLHRSFEIFPYAIERASSMSKEEQSTSRTKGFKI